MEFFANHSFISYFNFFLKICFKRAVQFFLSVKKFFSENLGFFGILGYPRKSRDIFENPGMGIPGFEFKIPGISISRDWNFFRGMEYPIPELPLVIMTEFCCCRRTSMVCF